ncbi:MAG TPA: ATP-binding protein [Anaerolineae bacterium]|nr:ATP-binding protein [Anaerolineae bacterium]
MSDAEARVRRLERILEISRELTSTVALEPLLEKIGVMAAELTDSAGSSILLRDMRTGELRFCTAAGVPPGQLADIAVPIEGSIAGTVLTSREPLIAPDAQADPRHYGEVRQQSGLEVRSLLAVPLQIKDRCIGVVEAVNKQGGQQFIQEDVETLMALAAQAAVAIENARLVGALRKAYDRLGQLDRLKSDFIAIASHELRTPLSLILLYAAVLRGQLGDASGTQVEAVQRAAMRLKNIIDTMLNLRYLETGQMDLAPACFDLRAEVEGACEDYEALAETGGVELFANVPDGEVLVFADREKVRVMLDNLISNAVRFTPPGGRVRVMLGGQGDEVEVAVIDTGVGIAPEELERIFDRFYQVEDPMTRRHGGMGLGLTIVKELVNLHGGRVWAESVPGQGSRFVVALPTRVSPGEV